MRKVREVLRLHYAAGLSTRAIARSLKVSPATVGKYIRRAEEQGLSWPLPEPLDDAALERRLFPAPVLSATQRPLPQWSEVHRELRQPDFSLVLACRTPVHGDAGRYGACAEVVALSLKRRSHSSSRPFASRQD